MKSALQDLLKGAKSAAEVTEALAREGMNSVETGLRGMGLCRSLSALSVAELERDETHYLLIPSPSLRKEVVEFSLFSKRVIPEGYGVNNSLPKERVFHLSDLSVEERLRSQLKDSLVLAGMDNADRGALDFADRLELLAQEVDQETEKVSGGILIVGGLTTLINPVAGIGMMASGVLPRIGGKLARSGASLAGDQLRGWSEKTGLKRLERKAESEIKRLKPQIFINPVLKRLEALLSNAEDSGDPLLEGYEPVRHFPQMRYLQVTIEALAEVYRDELVASRSSLTKPARAWVQSLVEMRV